MPTPQVHTIAADRPDDVLAALDEAGAVIVSGVATPAQVEAIRRELTPDFEAAQFGFEDYSGLRTKRTHMLMRSSPTMRACVLHPTMLAVGAKFLGGHEKFQLHSTQGIQIWPGANAQPLHMDDQFAFSWPPRPRPQFIAVFLMAIDPFTVENGATCIVPGSHTWGADRFPTEDDPIVQAEMDPGSVAIVLGATFHGGGANRSDAPRMGARFAYSRGWLRQEENQYLVFPPDVAATLDDDLRALIGYQVVNGLGNVGDPEIEKLIAEEAPPDFVLEMMSDEERAAVLANRRGRR